MKPFQARQPRNPEAFGNSVNDRSLEQVSQPRNLISELMTVDVVTPRHTTDLSFTTRSSFSVHAAGA